MSVQGFNAIVPLGGVAGYNALLKTQGAQQKRLQNSAFVKRDIAYFTKKIDAVDAKTNRPTIDTSAELANDTRLRTFLLTAYNLGDQADRKGLTQKVLASNLTDSKSVANKLPDKRWLSAAQAFKPLDATAPEAELLRERAENNPVWKSAAVNSNVFGTFLAATALAPNADTTGWNAVLTNKTALTVFQKALDLPDSFVKNIADATEEQLQSEAAERKTQLQKALETKFGASTLSQFADNTTRSVAFGNLLQLTALAASVDITGQAETDGWKAISANKAALTVFQQSLKLPDSFLTADADAQKIQLQQALQTKFGTSTLSQFADNSKITKLQNAYMEATATAGNKITQLQNAYLDASTTTSKWKSAATNSVAFSTLLQSTALASAADITGKAEADGWKAISASKAALTVFQQALKLPDSFLTADAASQKMQLQMALQTSKFKSNTLSQFTDSTKIKQLQDAYIKATATAGNWTSAVTDSESFGTLLGKTTLWSRATTNSVAFDTLLQSTALTPSADTDGWQAILTSKAALTVFQQALNLPDSFLTADADAQKIRLQQALQTKFGTNTLSQFTDRNKITQLQNAYIEAAATTSQLKSAVTNSVAFVTLLQSTALTASADTDGWAAISANNAALTVFQQALTLPKSFLTANAISQKIQLQGALKTKFGDASLSQFTDSTKITKLQNAYIEAADISGWNAVSADKTTIAVFQKALSLPESFLTANAASQKTQLQAALKTKFGDASLSQFADSNKITQLQNAYIDTTATAAADRATFKKDVIAAYTATQWQDAVQAADTDIGLAVYFQKRIGQVATSSSVDKSGWYTVIAEKPLRDVFEKVFGLASSFWQIDVDKQVPLLKKNAQQTFGSESLSVFKDPTKVTKAINTYLNKAQADNAQNTPPRAVSILNYTMPSENVDLSGIYSTLTLPNGRFYSASLLNQKV